MSATQEFNCKRESLNIKGTVYLPEGCEGKKLPVIVMCHELQANRRIMKHYALAMADEGYAVFTFDFCGGSNISESDGLTTDMSVITEMKDLRAVMDYIKSCTFADMENVTLMGGSQGGFVAAYISAEKEYDIKNLILLYPAFCIPHDSAEGYLIEGRYDPTDLPEKVNCGNDTWLGKVFITDALGLDYLKDICGYKNRVLLIHGTADKLVDIDYSRRAHKAYINNGNEVKFIELPGAEHIFRNREHFNIALDHIKQFLKERS